MRITAGTLRGRRLTVYGGRATRPTSSMVREAIFNVVRDRIGGARVLDLFAGSGALGIEALSRGAAQAAFVDSSVVARKAIRENLRALGLKSQGRVLGSVMRSVIKSLSENGERFDIVFMDPPYGRGIAAESLEAVSQGGIVADDGVVVVECGKRELPGEKCGRLRLHTRKRYGDTQLFVFKMTSPARGERPELQQGGSG